MRRKLQDTERQLAVWHAEFPELFLSATPPLLLKAESRTDGKVWGVQPAAARPAYGTTEEYLIAELARAQGPVRTSDLTRLLRCHPTTTTNSLNKLLAEKRVVKVKRGSYQLLVDRANQAPAAAEKPSRMSKAKKKRARKNSGGKYWKERWYLRLQEHGPEYIADTARALGARTGTNIKESSQSWIKAGIIVQQSDGSWSTSKIKPDPVVLRSAVEALEGRQNGAHA